MSHQQFIALGFSWLSGDENLRWGFAVLEDGTEVLEPVATLKTEAGDEVFFQVYSLVDPGQKQRSMPEVVVFQAAFFPPRDYYGDASPFIGSDGRPLQSVDISDSQGIARAPDPAYPVIARSGRQTCVGLGGVPADKSWTIGPLTAANRGVFRMSFTVVARNQSNNNFSYKIFMVDPEMEVGEGGGSGS